MSRYPFGYIPFRAKTTPDWARAGRLLGAVAVGLATTTLLLVLIGVVFQVLALGIAATAIGAVAFVAGVLCALARRKAARQAGEQP